MTSARPDTAGCIGLDFGTRWTKAVRIRQIDRELRVDAACAVRTPAAMEGEPREVRLVAALDIALKSIPNAVQPVVFSVPTHTGVIKWLALPDLDEAELMDVARYRLAKQLPYAADDAYVSVDQREPDVEETLVSAVPKQEIDDRANALTLARLQPARSELEAQALIRLLKRGLSHRGSVGSLVSMTVVDLGAQHMQMFVLQDQLLQFTRSVSFGSERFFGRVATELGIDETEAEDAVLRQGALAQDGSLEIDIGWGPAKVSVRRDLEVLLNEFGRLLRYFRSLHPERSYRGILNGVVLSGGLAGLQGLDVYLSAALGMPVSRLKSFQGLQLDLPIEQFGGAIRAQPAYATAVGLALSAFEQRPPRTSAPWRSLEASVA